MSNDWRHFVAAHLAHSHSDFCSGFFVTAVKDLLAGVTPAVVLCTVGGGARLAHNAVSKVAAMAKIEAMQTLR